MMKQIKKILAILILAILVSSYHVSSISNIENEIVTSQNYTNNTRIIESTIEQSNGDTGIINLIANIDQELLYSYLENLTSFGPRITGSKACDMAAEYIYNEFMAMGLNTRYHNWRSLLGAGANVEAVIPGYDNTSDDVYIICAHYDSVMFSPGADDDASGVAVVMAAAKLMSNRSYRNTIKFVAFSGEERGLLGSYNYVKEIKNNDENVVGVLDVDMVGYGKEEYTYYLSVLQNSYKTNEWLTSYTINVSEKYQEYIDLEPIPLFFPVSSDFFCFYLAGYSAICYSTIIVNYSSFDFQLNPNVHSSRDTIDTLNFDYLVKNTKLIIATLAELADHEITEFSQRSNTKLITQSVISHYWFHVIFKEKYPLLIPFILNHKSI